METYKIVRFCFDTDNPAHGSVIATGLTLDEAQAHCNDPETSASTASDETLAAVGIDGPWFDGYTDED